MEIRKLLCLAVAGAAVLGLSACGTSEQVELPEEYEFVNDISGFQPDPNFPGSYVRPGYKDVDQYDNFMIENVAVVYTDKGMERLNDKDLTRIQDYFRDAIVAKLREGGYFVVETPHENMMTIQIAITGLEAPSGFGSEAANTGTALTVGVSSVVGKVTVEGAFVDFETGETQIIAADSRRGTYNNANPWSTWRDVELAMDDWALQMREDFDQIMANAKAN